MAGSMVAEETKTAPARMVSAAPAGPNSTASVWTALTTTQTTTSAPSAASAGVAAPRPPAASKRATASGFTSHAATEKPAFRSEPAMPAPIEPSPITAARPVCGVVLIGFRPVVLTMELPPPPPSAGEA